MTIGPAMDPVSRNVYALIFNALTEALNDDQWMPLSERERITASIYDHLREAGVDVRLAGG